MKPPRGEHRRPTFCSRRFCCSVCRKRKSFMETPIFKLFLLGVCTAGSRRVLGRFRQNLGGFAAGSCRFSVNSRRICIGFLLILVSAGSGLNFWSSGGPEGAQNGPRMAQKVATGSPRGSEKRSKNEAFFAKRLREQKKSMHGSLSLPFVRNVGRFLQYTSHSKIVPNIGSIFYMIFNGFRVRNWRQNQCKNQSKHH